MATPCPCRLHLPNASQSAFIAALRKPRKEKNHKMRNRHKAREALVEALYAWEAAGCDAAELPRIAAEKLADQRFARMDRDYFREALFGVAETRQALDAAIQKAARGRAWASIGAMERAILRLGAWELAERLEIPYRVVIHEALVLTETYAEAPAKRFVNAVLDRIARTLRAAEIQAEQNA